MMPIHSIQVVLVLYKTKLEDSLSYQTFCKYIGKISFPYNLLIYNNSPEIFIPKNADYTIYNADKNNMLSGAYNYAFQRAVKYGHNWLLLLDQDTSLTEAYFDALNLALLADVKAAAIFPILKNKKKHLSPHSYSPAFGHWGKIKNIKTKGFINNKIIAAFNSAALISTSALQAIGGFPEEFPLYELDYCVFYRLSKNNESFYLLDVTLIHDLTMLDYQNKMTILRYHSIIDAENKFSKQIGILAIITFKIKLFFRFMKQLIINEKRKYALITLKYLYK